MSAVVWACATVFVIGLQGQTYQVVLILVARKRKGLCCHVGGHGWVKDFVAVQYLLSVPFKHLRSAKIR